MTPAMYRTVLRQVVKFLRLPALALVVLAVLVNPVFAAVGDLHESSHAGIEHLPAPGDHDHDHDHNAGLDEDTPASGEGDGKLDLLHALMHAAHCCGHLTAILSASVTPQSRLFSEARPLPHFTAPGPAPHTDHFRPPIAI